MSLRILQIAADARWVGRDGPPMRRFGVPEGGPFDRESWAWCIALARCDQAIEIGPFGATFLCEAAMSIVMAGAERMCKVGDRRLGNGLFTISAGATLEIGPVSRGARTYLGLVGESPNAPELARGGSLTGRSLNMDIPLGMPAPSLSREPIRVLPGPQSEQFDLATFLTADWHVSLEADRVGLRLKGMAVNSKQSLGEMPSEPQVVGAIQITSGGTPIIIGPDGPTIGGYPKIATVIDADRDKLGQLVPNDPIRFALVDLATARALGVAYRLRLRDAPAMRFERS